VTGGQLVGWAEGQEGGAERARRPPGPGGRSGDGCGEAPEGGGRLPHPHGEVVAAAGGDGVGQLVVQPLGEHLDGHGLGRGRPDGLEVAVAQAVGDLGERLVEQVEVADHAPVVEVGAADDDLQPVVVGVELALGPLHARHHVQRPHLDRRPDLVHGAHVYHSAACTRPDAPASTAANARGASAKGKSWVASGVRGSSSSSVRATARRRARVQRPDSAAGIVDTWVLRTTRRRRWKSPPSGSATSFVPYHDTTSASPSWASRPSAVRRASGRPLASTTSGTPSGAASARTSPTASGATAGTPIAAATDRRPAAGSTPVTRAPARCSSSEVARPTAPSPVTSTGSSSTGPASSATCSAVSTRGSSVARRGSTPSTGTTSSTSTTNRSWWGW